MKTIFITLPIISLLLSGCSIAQKATEQVQQKAEQAAAEQAVRANCKYDKDVCEYFVAQAKSFSQSVTMKTSFSGKEKSFQGMESITKLDSKGNMQSISTKSGKEESNMIIFNNVTYIKDYTDSKWFKMSSGKEDESSVFNMKETIDEMKDTFKEENDKLTVTKVGQEACGNLTCVIYEMADKDFGKSKVWIDTKDHLARKMEIINEGATTTITYAYEPVTIAEPSPVKEFSAPKIPAVKNGQLPSQAELEKMMENLPDLPEIPEGEE